MNRPMPAKITSPRRSTGEAMENCPTGGRIQYAVDSTASAVASNPGPKPASNATTITAG